MTRWITPNQADFYFSEKPHKLNIFRIQWPCEMFNYFQAPNWLGDSVTGCFTLGRKMLPLREQLRTPQRGQENTSRQMPGTTGRLSRGRRLSGTA